MDEPTLCRTCVHLKYCELLGSTPTTNEEALSTDEDPLECREWASAGVTSRAVRLKAYEIGGRSALGAVRTLSELTIKEVEVGDTEKPDIRGIAGDMIAYKAREEQLRYMTDDDGTYLLDTHEQKIPRETFWLREYAVDPDGPVAADKDVVWFWSRKQLIDAILKAEKEQGIVASASEVKKATRSPNKTAPKAAAPKKETRIMKKINIRRGGALAGGSPEAPAEEAKETKGTKGPKGPKAGGGSKLGRPATGKAAVETSEAAPAASVDLGPIQTELADMRKQLTDTQAQLQEATEIIVATTKLHCALLHDVVMQVMTETDENNITNKGGDLEVYMEGADSGS